jgi:hypothetical protein
MSKVMRLSALLVLTGCASTGVITIDKGLYQIAKQAPQVSFGPPVGTKADIYREAGAFCERQGKVIETVKIEEVNQVFGRQGSASLTFRCVTAG